MEQPAPPSLEGVTLHVKDVEASFEFYQKLLPQASVIVYRKGQLAILQVGKSRLGLLRNDEIPFHLEIDVADVDAMYQHVVDSGLANDGPPEDKPWGERDFYARDPDGNTIEFSAPRR